MVFGEILTGIALVKSSVEFIKSNISTCKDISEIAGHIDDLFEGQKEVNKKRNKRDGLGIADQLGIKSVASEIIDGKLAAEKLYEVSVLVDQRFGHGTWASILLERKKRIDEAKKMAREAIKVRKQKQDEIIEMISFVFLGLVGLSAVVGGIYVFINI